MTQQLIFPAVSYHSLSLRNKSNYGVPSVSGPALVTVSENYITIRYFHSPESLKATLVSLSFSPHIKILFSNYVSFLCKIISNSLVLSASFPTTTTASQTAFISPADTYNSVFTGLPKYALQLLQAFYMLQEQ